MFKRCTACRDWFESASTLPLGVLRILLVGYLMLFRFSDRQFLFDWSQKLPAAFMNEGTFLRMFPLPFPMGLDHYALFFALLHITGWMAVFGILTRISLILFTTGWAFVVAQESAWGWHDHGPSLVVQVLLILCLAPGISALSIDRAAASIFKDKQLCWRNLLPENGLRWPMQAVFLLVVAFYTTSGISKIRYGGLAWLDGNTLAFYFSGQSKSNQLQQFGSRKNVPEEEKWRDGFGIDYYLYGSGTSTIGSIVAQSPVLAAIAACCGVALELFFPLALLGRRFRVLFLLGAIGFHCGALFTMGISFMSWVMIDVALLFWTFADWTDDKWATPA